MNNHEEFEQFLKIKDQFHLGKLPTEMPHPLSTQLSFISKTSLPKAYEIFKEIDLQVLLYLKNNLQKLSLLNQAIQDCLERGRKIYISGCGATGRLALTLEKLWRISHPTHPLENRVIGFMAGGDLAFIHSLESFEDHQEFGARQLRELNFGDGDLLIAVTEGGETPFVIGTVWEALKISKQKPFFVFCNPVETLKMVAKRSQEILDEPAVLKVCFEIGPMALAGSTRLQATTIQQLGLSLAFLQREKFLIKSTEILDELIDSYINLPREAFYKWSEYESGLYLQGEKCNYLASEFVSTVLLTDTTERSPTFSLPSFENVHETPSSPSHCFLFLKDTLDSASAWEAILGHKPRSLEWSELNDRASGARLIGFDLSEGGPLFQKYRKGFNQNGLFEFENSAQEFRLKFGGNEWMKVPMPRPLLSQMILLKMMFNAHSTITMGRLGRYYGNIMTFVRPSNFKLIDRAVRYVEHMIEDMPEKPSYDEIARIIYEKKDGLKSDMPIVEVVVEEIKSRYP